MNKSVYCEPFCIEKGRNFEVHHVKYDEKDPYHCFMHFHEVHEFIIFEKIEGQYFYSQGESELDDFDIVFTPALETHNFSCSDREKSWFIVQFMPHVLGDEKMAKANAYFQHGLHLRLPKSRITEIQQQVHWLLESYQQDPNSARSLVLLQLLILTIGEYAKPALGGINQPITYSPLYEKMLPVINQFRSQSAVELSLIEAANMCHLSPSHFSRMFKQIFRVNFSEYALRHKLYSAARLLSQSTLSITQISYELNFSSPSHFIAQFKKQFSKTPRQFRASMTNTE
ncbi:helix-turn-helix domain-containing protein [Alteromonas macleodii]|uniref:helix-turn-helix domain-containing protein n=1 Tax=Alteromonas macleodii TaxID=28108 RepID=UPI00207687D2|nr:AraC family transcriptional regulator [Alteromonas macleodii]USI26425.1 AraC family transcriptional regulator [Alteromonas macleodii]